MNSTANNSILLRYPRNTETVITNSKALNVSHALTQVQRPLDSTKLTVEIFGIYALPEQWKTAIQTNDPAESGFTYEIEVAGVKMVGAKGYPRELTEEEKQAAAAAAPQKGKAPPAKGKPADEKLPTPEELAAIERERHAKEEELKRTQAEWDKLDDQTKFYRTAENIQKEPKIAIENKIVLPKLKAAEEKLAQL